MADINHINPDRFSYFFRVELTQSNMSKTVIKNLKQKKRIWELAVSVVLCEITTSRMWHGRNYWMIKMMDFCAGDDQET